MKKLINLLPLLFTPLPLLGFSSCSDNKTEVLVIFNEKEVDNNDKRCGCFIKVKTEVNDNFSDNVFINQNDNFWVNLYALDYQHKIVGEGVLIGNCFLSAKSELDTIDYIVKEVKNLNKDYCFIDEETGEKDETRISAYYDDLSITFMYY